MLIKLHPPLDSNLPDNTYYVDTDIELDRFLPLISKLDTLNIELPTGKKGSKPITINLRPGSVPRIALTQVFTFVFVPLLSYAASKLGIMFRAKEKREDPIPYCLMLYLEVVKKATRNMVVDVGTEPYVDEMQLVTSYHATMEDTDVTPMSLLMPGVEDGRQHIQGHISGEPLA